MKQLLNPLTNDVSDGKDYTRCVPYRIRKIIINAEKIDDFLKKCNSFVMNIPTTKFANENISHTSGEENVEKLEFDIFKIIS